MTPSSGLLQLLAVEESLRFRDNYGESIGDCKMKSSRITINADGLRYFAYIIMHNLL